MTSLRVTRQISLSRRSFLQASGIALALPWLDAMRPAFGADPKPTLRFIGVQNCFGFYPPYFFPEDTGANYTPSSYLQPLQEHRNDFTVFSGLQHPDVTGGHIGDLSFFTGARFPGSPVFRNSISIDQCIAENAAKDVRYPALSLSTHSTLSGSYTRAGIAVPAFSSPRALFSKLFLQGSPAEVERELTRLQRGQSILDRLLQKSRRLESEVGASDREKLDEYFTSVRELETRLHQNEHYARQPKPNPGVRPVVDPGPGEQTRKLGLLLEVSRLALQADLTRAVAIFFGGTTKTPSDPGSSFAHHDLTHHGQSPEKLEQLALLESDLLSEWSAHLRRLKQGRDATGTQLQSTINLLGSPLGNASMHHNMNLPILLAGGRFQHGQHLAFDPKNAPPLCDLYLQILQETGGEVSQFGSSTGTGIRGLRV
jgi:hypothetical protein